MILDALKLTALHLALLLAPLTLAAVVLHQLNVITTRVLGSAFGSGAVIWFTGWLGTPIHELSHAAACALFRHRIQEIVLFRPDPESGVVGYVRHSWSPRNPWAVLGRGFVGIAPLFGGAAVLALVLFLLAPRDLVDGLFRLELAADTSAFAAQLAAWVDRVQQGARALVDPRHLTRPASWLLAYLALCVGTHLAPSGADLRGAWPSLGALVALLAAADLALVLALGPAGTRWILAAASLTVPVVAVLALASLLVGAALAVVFVAASAWSALTGRGIGAPLRVVLAQPWRLAAVGAVVALAVRLA